MNKRTLTLPLVIGLINMMGQAWAASSDTIAVTVSLVETISVSVTPNSWNIGAVSLSSTSGPASFTATNDGNTTSTLDIMGADGSGGWIIGTPPGADRFEVAVTAPAITLTKSYQQLAASLGIGADQDFQLTYKSPTSDSKGGGVNQGFTITVKASAAP